MKIKVDAKQIKFLGLKIEDIRKQVPKEIRPKFKLAAELMKTDIVNTILRGNSPVKGQKRFVDYRPSYKEQIQGQASYRTITRGQFKGKKIRIRPQLGADKSKFQNKRLRPVNMQLSGRMLESIAARMTKGGFVIYFTSKLARYHSILGAAGKAYAIRKVAPYNGEQWKRSVPLTAQNFLRTQTIKRLVSKLRRLK